MSSSAAASLPLADRLVTACHIGDLQSVKTLLAEGASVLEKGTIPRVLYGLPLQAVVLGGHFDVVLWLLSHGADPNGNNNVMIYNGARWGTPAILQLLIDAGGGVDNPGTAPLFWAVYASSMDKVRLLLAQPALEIARPFDGKVPEKWARDAGRPAFADVIAYDVSRGAWRLLKVSSVFRRLLSDSLKLALFVPVVCGCVSVLCLTLLLVSRGRDERRWYDRGPWALSFTLMTVRLTWLLCWFAVGSAACEGSGSRRRGEFGAAGAYCALRRRPSLCTIATVCHGVYRVVVTSKLGGSGSWRAANSCGTEALPVFIVGCVDPLCGGYATVVCCRMLVTVPSPIWNELAPVRSSPLSRWTFPLRRCNVS